MAKRKVDPAIAPIKKAIVEARRKLRKRFDATGVRVVKKRLHHKFVLLRRSYKDLGFGLLWNFENPNGGGDKGKGRRKR